MTITTTVVEREREPRGVPLSESVTDEDVQFWLSPENLESKSTRVFAGFEITDSIDGAESDHREVSLVRLLESQVYPQHVHRGSDTLFIIVEGEAILLSGRRRIPIKAGARISVPRGMPHGFELHRGVTCKFISIQQPPIRDRHTGEEDLDVIDEPTLISMV
jgi:mannose-6-phosphate isomerase-like protein (cupin superfamily)